MLNRRFDLLRGVAIETCPRIGSAFAPFPIFPVRDPPSLGFAMGSTRTKEKDGPNALAVGILFLLLGLSALSSAVDGPATIIVLVTTLCFLSVMWMVTVGWGDSRVAVVQRTARAPVAAASRAVRPSGALPRGRVVGGPGRARATPTV